MIIYVYSKCSTCKDALRFLKDKGVKVAIEEITETPPSLKELEKMLGFQHGNLKKLFNSSGNLYKELNLAEKLPTITLKESLELLTKHGMLVKRPFLLGNDFGLLGFNANVWAEKF